MSVFDRTFNVIYIRTVQGCNLNCTHCFTLGNKDPIQITDFKLIEGYLQAIKDNVDPQKVTFYIHGGETFLAPLSYLAKVNQCIRDTFPGINMDIIPQTNLTLTVDDEFIQFIKDEYRGTIGVSWDADIRFNTINQEHRFFRNLAKLIDAGIKVHIAITAQRHLLNYDPVVIADMFKGVDSIDFELLTAFDEKSRDLKPNNVTWSNWLDRLVDYYQHNPTTWCLPQVDLFTKSIRDNKIYDCKCNCCDERTFTLNPDGTVGLCPDRTYIEPLATVESIQRDWADFESKATEVITEKVLQSHLHEMCYSCEHYDVCGGNCEYDLFDDTEECPLSRKVVTRVRNNIETFSRLYDDKAKINLTELREDYHEQ